VLFSFFSASPPPLPNYPLSFFFSFFFFRRRFFSKKEMTTPTPKVLSLDEQLLEACKKPGNVEEIKALLAKGANAAYLSSLFLCLFLFISFLFLFLFGGEGIVGERWGRSREEGKEH